MPTISVYLPDGWKDEIDETLEYGDSRSEFFQDAVKKELERRKEGTSGEGGEDA